MKFQWTLIFALVFAILVAIFAIANIDAVPINYVFGKAEVPLVLVILSSTLLGGLIVGLVGIIRQYRLQRRIRSLEKQLEEAKAEREASEEAGVPLDELPEAEATTTPESAEYQDVDSPFDLEKNKGN